MVCLRRGIHLVAVIVECCVLYPCCVGVFGIFAVM